MYTVLETRLEEILKTTADGVTIALDTPHQHEVTPIGEGMYLIVSDKPGFVMVALVDLDVAVRWAAASIAVERER